MSERDRPSSFRGSFRGARDSAILRRNSVILDLEDLTLELESIVSKMSLSCFDGNAAGLVWQLGTRRAIPTSPERMWDFARCILLITGKVSL